MSSNVSYVIKDNDIDTAIEEFKQAFTLNGTHYGRWNWDETWDGVLVHVLKLLQMYNFDIARFNRGRVISIRFNKTEDKELQVARILHVIKISNIDRMDFTTNYCSFSLNKKFRDLANI